MTNNQTEDSAIQPPLTCHEVVQVLRDVVLGRLQMTRIYEQSWDEMTAELLLVQVDTWTLAIYKGANKLDYCQRCSDSSGRRWSFVSSSRSV